MSKYCDVKKTAVALAVAGCAAFAGPALANIQGSDNDFSGDYNSVPLAYGNGGQAFLSVLLYTPDLSDVGTTNPFDVVAGSQLEFSYAQEGNSFNAPVVDLAYTITNTGLTDWTSLLRAMIIVNPNGSGSNQDIVSENWPAAGPGNPRDRHVASPGGTLIAQITGADNFTDGVNGCGVNPCDAEFAFKWEWATLPAGESVTFQLRLVDDPSLIAGGRYLAATSVGGLPSNVLYAGNPQLVPEPESYAMLLAGLGVLGFLRMRSTRQ